MIHGERLSRLLTVIIGQKVTVKQVLPSQSKRLAAEASLIIMDIVVELESGALANVEIQKVGYHFPGQRSACYSSDLIIRQYDRQKSLKKKKFSYRDLQKVYTIVLVEHSSREFHQIPDQYIHRSSQKFDTGLELELLQEYIFIALDIFQEITHNIDKELDAWLYFLSSDKPEDMIRVTEAYPAFRELYMEIAEFQRKPEELIAMYNETLALYDKNTVELMIEEQQEEIRRLEEEAQKREEELRLNKEELRAKDDELELLRRELAKRAENT
ncbi:PD-(D/E)XK nuclease-like transposase [Hungatella effluvii]|uniref:PD-(D/E)XK nuclease-like transposase n=1 Tax=Hungatella effluvii TaxID=1096246 RepID=A0A2V3XUR5_9FIRM|nr:PD-(D/E)XK nuclease family transposase [Hungatella effluvii]PXX44772.1 PD-(D/E)XK nuclease-like transposase [Hungatella effluvii]